MSNYIKPKVLRISTVALSLDYLLKGQLAFLNREFEVVAISGEDRHLHQVAFREGVRTVNVPMERSIRPWADLISLWKLYQLCTKERPKIVHSITPKAGLLSMTAAYFAKVPIRIHTFTGLVFPARTGLFKLLLMMMDKLLCRFATHIYPEGQGVKNDLIKYKITGKPLNVLANGNVNGLDVSFFSPEHFTGEDNGLRRDLNIKTNDFVFVFVGRLVGDKGVNEMVQAFQRLGGEFDNCKLLLVGPFEPTLDPLSSEAVNAIGNNENILTVGLQEDVRPYFAISDTLVFPSYREGFPNVVLQAGAMGLPSIVSDINGCNEIITDGKNGLIIPPKDPEAVYIAMKRIREDGELRNRLKKEARPMIVSRYEQKIVWEALLAEYKRLEKDVS